MNEDLYQRYAASVKESCENYIKTKDPSVFLKYTDNISNIYESNKKIFSEEYDIISTNMQGYFGNDDLCTIIAILIIQEKDSTSFDGISVDVCIPCRLIDDNVSFDSVRVNFAKKQTTYTIEDTDNLLKYKKVLGYMNDIIMEYNVSQGTLIYDKKAYKDFFHVDTNYTIMDEWFWDMCTYYVHEDDREKLDMFRDVDLLKRIHNKDLVFQTHVRIKRDNNYFWTKLTFVIIPCDKELAVESVFILIQDYSSAMAERMTNLMYARIDSLTQTWNRRYSEELISKRIKTNGNGLFAIFDIDNFKTVNDSLGHLTGDQLLKKVSHIVCDNITDDDVFGRLGGDEFILYLKGDFNDCLTHFHSIMDKLKFNYFENDDKISITCSAGVARINGRRTSFTELYESADAALYDAKRSGKSIHKISLASLIEDEDDE